jgi:muramoyltetrapeptide carboxypeptidase
MASIIIPPALQPGDLIGITCPAGYVASERIAHAVQVLQEWGYRVRVGNTIGIGDHYFAGHDDERLADLQSMLDDGEVRAVLMGRGGYGTSRIIDRLDFSAFRQRPKWICGFSDITVLHSHIHQQSGIATLHSPMCGAFTPETENSDHILAFKAALGGALSHYHFEASPWNRPGTARGGIVGGNLAILAHLSGSASQLNTAGKILFIEDVGEHLYNIDRLLLNLKRSGQLDHLTGLMVGQFTDNQDTERPFGQTLEQIINDKVAEYGYPIAWNVPCGHDSINITLPLGCTGTLTVGDAGAELRFSSLQQISSF